MNRILSPSTWVRRSAENPKRVLIVWALILVASLAVNAIWSASATTTDQSFVGAPEYDRATALIEDTIGQSDASVETVVLSVSSGRIDADVPRAAITKMADSIRSLGPDLVASVATPWSGGDATLISKDGRTAIVPVTMGGNLNDAREHIGDVLEITDAVDGTAGMKVAVAGQAAIDLDVQEVAQSDLKTGEGIGILVAMVILVLVFGALASAILPVVLAIVSIIVALALVAIIGRFYQLQFFVTNMIAMMGLAVGIDYALFIVSRFREERAAGTERIEAIVRAGDTAGRAVLFSGITVVVALIGMLIVPMSVFLSLGAGAILVVLVALAASLTLLPAALSLTGDRINAGRVSRLLPRALRERTGGGFWPKAVGAVMRRPATSFLVTAAVLIAAAIPYFTIQTGAAGVSTLPANLDSRQAFETLQRDFSIGAVAPARIPIVGDTTSPESTATIAKITAAVAGDPVLGTPYLEPGATARGGILSVPINAEPASRESASAVRRLRDATDIPVGGTPSQNVDYFDISDRYLPIVMAIRPGDVSFILLLLAFRSIVVPRLAIVVNLLSVGAAFGLLVLVFQKGYGADLLGFQQVPTIEAWVPLFLFSVLFGLSMDYHVFLLSPHQGALHPDRRQRRGGHPRDLDERAPHHRCCPDHGRRLRRLRRRQPRDVPADGLRARRRRPDRRHTGAHDPGAGRHEAPRPPQLVPAEGPLVAPAPVDRGAGEPAPVGLTPSS